MIFFLNEDGIEKSTYLSWWMADIKGQESDNKPVEFNKPFEFSKYKNQMLRDTFQNWESEFLQLIWR
ncbi:MAG: hypothetical protein ACPK85_11025 [Methanosarcina sp.]